MKGGSRFWQLYKGRERHQANARWSGVAVLGCGVMVWPGANLAPRAASEIGTGPSQPHSVFRLFPKAGCFF